MILSDGDILAALDSKELEIEPFCKEQLNPGSYDLRLTLDSAGILEANAYRTVLERQDWVRKPCIDPRNKESYTLNRHTVARYKSEFVIEPGEVLIASTKERLVFGRNICGQLGGKSSLARLGLAVHITAGWIDPGFAGQVVLEIVNHNSFEFVVYEGMLIAQMIFMPIQNVLIAYNEKDTSKYRDQEAGQGSLYYLNEVKK